MPSLALVGVVVRWFKERNTIDFVEISGKFLPSEITRHVAG